MDFLQPGLVPLSFEMDVAFLLMSEVAWSTAAAITKFRWK